MTQTAPTCIDRIPPLELHDDIDDVALRVTSGDEGAVMPRYRWPTGSTLRVLFHDGPPGLRSRVIEAASAWTDHANLTFRVVDRGDAEIRVTFQDHGNWSILGTQALSREFVRADQPTMCLEEVATATDDRLAWITRHEFGHAIGLVHEHSSPAAEIRWNRDAVYQELAGPPNFWSRGMVDQNVIHRYSAGDVQFSSFDPASVMLYPIPARWTLEPVPFHASSTLSPGDCEFARTLYPF